MAEMANVSGQHLLNPTCRGISWTSGQEATGPAKGQNPKKAETDMPRSGCFPIYREGVSLGRGRHRVAVALLKYLMLACIPLSSGLPRFVLLVLSAKLNAPRGASLAPYLSCWLMIGKRGYDQRSGCE